MKKMGILVSSIATWASKLLTAVFVFTAALPLSAFAETTTFSPYDYQSSFHSLIQSHQFQASPNISAECLDRLSARLERKDSFFSEKLVPYTQPLNSNPNTTISDAQFSHYTKAKAMIGIANQNSKEDIFLYLRKSPQLRTFSYLFYVAGDDKSSSFYGPIHIKITSSASALVFDPLQGLSATALEVGASLGLKQDVPRLLEVKRGITQEIETELLSRYPDLQSCVLPNEAYLQDFSILVLLAIEANQVSYITYYGSDSPGRPWLQAVGEWSITDLSHQK